MRFAPAPGGGGRIAYAVSGDGDATILLVSPLVGTIELWGDFRARLAAHARVIAFDHRGLGASSRAPVSTTTRSLARDALAVLDDAGVARASIFGISLGGLVATWLAADAPARVGRVVLASTSVRGLELATSARSVLRGARLVACVVRGDAALGRCLADGVLSEPFQAAHPDEATRVARAITDAPRSRRSVVVLAAAAARHDARDALARIAAPVLVLGGELDPLVPPARQPADFAGLRDVRFDVIAGAGHALALERPVEAAARVLAFVRPPSPASAPSPAPR